MAAGLSSSAAVGAGTRFTVTLPRPAVPADVPVPVPSASGSRERRSPVSRRPAATSSSSRTIPAPCACCGPTWKVRATPCGPPRTAKPGLLQARRSPPAAIVLDVLLPGIDGWEVLRTLKADPLVRDVPVTIATVVEEHGVGLRLGAVDYFLKPGRAQRTPGPPTRPRRRRASNLPASMSSPWTMIRPRSTWCRPFSGPRATRSRRQPRGEKPSPWREPLHRSTSSSATC